MKSILKGITILLFLPIVLSAQSELFLEIYDGHSGEVYRYYPGDKIRFTTKDFPDEWRKARVKKIIPEENIFILSSDYLSPEDIHSVKISNGTANTFSHIFTKFGLGWILFGAVAKSDGFNMSTGDLIIGGAATLIGWVLKLFKHKKLKLNDRRVLRIMDVRFPEPVFETP